MPEVIRLITQFFKTIIKESFYITNYKADVIYPYLTFSYTAQPFSRKNGNEIYIDFDVFDNQGNNNERIETVVNDLIEAVEDSERNVINNDELLIRIEGISINLIPTNSDTLQRRNGTINLRIDWRNL